MDEITRTVTALSAYRILTIIIGLIVIYFGYRLFRVGMYERAGELKAVWGNRYMAVRQAAPGTFFALFGALIIMISIWKGFSVEKSADGSSSIRDSSILGAFLNQYHSQLVGVLNKLSKNEPLTATDSVIVKNWLIEQSNISVQAQQERDLLPQFDREAIN